MSRRWIVLQAALLAILGAALIIAAAIYFSWRLNRAETREALAITAAQTATHVGQIYDEVSLPLRLIATTHFLPCSPEQILRMRELMVQTPNVAGMVYARNEVPECSPFGPIEEPLRPIGARYQRSDGIELVFDVYSRFATAPMIALRLGDYAVLLEPKQLLGYALHPAISLALLAGDGRLVATRNHPDPSLVAKLAAASGTGELDDEAYAVRHQDQWTIVVVEPSPSLVQHIYDESPVLIPVGLAATAFSFGVMAWVSRRRLSPRGELATAVRQREFVVHYQPIIELRSGCCIGAEALIRWMRPDGTMVRPDLFIPLAEESGLIIPITDQLIERVILDLTPTLVADRSLHIAINLCAADISSGRFLPVLSAALANTGIEPQQILLEATERGFVDVEGARRTLTEALRIGHPTAIDDFGTGYSSLQYLQSLPITALKIDKSFVDTIGKDAATSSVTAHIIGMAKALNLLIVAEGVETLEQADYLAEREVDFVQGWLFARAMPAAEFIAFCEQRRARYGSADAGRRDRVAQGEAQPA